MAPKKRSRVGEELPLEEDQQPTNPEHDVPSEEEQRPITSEYQTTLDDILGLLRAQTDEIRALRERIHELENDRTTTPPVRPSSPALSIGSNPSDSSDSSDLSDSSNGSDKSASSARSGRSNSSSKTRTRDPKVTPPDLFYGKTSEFQNFVTQCSLTLTMCPNTYNSNQKRVLFVISNLRGTPLSWARKIISNKGHPLRKNYTAFMAALTNIYGDRAYELECEDRLNRLIQTGSAASYAQTFQSLAIPLGIDDKSQCIMFYGGLNDKVKEAIIIAGRKSKIQALINQAINLDQMLYQQTRRQKREPQDDFSYPNKKRQTNRIISSRTPDSRTPVNTTRPSIPLPDTTSHFRLPLTEREKEHRRQNNLCAYCGDSEHTVETCPQVKKKNDFVQNPTSNSNKSSVSNVNNPKLHSPLLYPVPTRPFSAPPSSENWQSRPPRM
jgi:hypothetical protein